MKIAVWLGMTVQPDGFILESAGKGGFRSSNWRGHLFLLAGCSCRKAT
jgi:hypothetical protein